MNNSAGQLVLIGSSTNSVSLNFNNEDKIYLKVQLIRRRSIHKLATQARV